MMCNDSLLQMLQIHAPQFDTLIYISDLQLISQI